MATASSKTAREIKALGRRGARAGTNLTHELAAGTHRVTERAGELISSTARSARRHPWASAGLVLGTVAAIGGVLWARQR